MFPEYAQTIIVNFPKPYC